MIRSMTGFARREQSGAWGTLTWELRAVNHRYLEVACRLPDELRPAESDFRQAVGAALRRGKVDCTLNYRPATEALSEIEIDAPLVAQLLNRARDIAALAGQTAAIDPLDLLRWPGVIRNSEADATPLAAAAQASLNEALQVLNDARAREGERIRELLMQRCAMLLALVEAVVARLPEVRTRMRTRLLEKLAQLGGEPNAERLEQELVFLAQRMDVDEELERLKGHVVEIRKALDGSEPAGRRLDFLMQELNREANTLSSKSQDAETTRVAVDMKVIIEQMREQVQNVE
ncbi:MAG TPA: YicC/YloC family endoribonuclease [Steroidobacteraceae bacterium]|nr:YicC/YloC family endoribonuclease [Steroidobacteraceae bacterium]